MKTDNEFSKRDAAGIISLVRNAPLQNMQHADNVLALLDRFADWYEKQAAEEAAKIVASSELAKIGSIE